MTLISIITPCYNEEDNVEECYQQIKDLFVTKLQEYNYELIFCDNASTDNTLAIMRTLAAKDNRVKVIANSRNVGAFKNAFNGLKWASGDAVLHILAADLQDPPELIVDFVKYWSEGYKIVYGIRAKRNESWILENSRKAYYRIIASLASVSLPPDVGEFQLLDRQVVDILTQINDHYPYTRGLIAQCGFSAKGIPYLMQARKKGKSKADWFHLIDVAINGIISMSNVPIRIITLSGFTLALFSLIYSIITLIISLVIHQKLIPPGIPTLIVALFFFSSVQIFLMGILGEYLAAIHSQVRPGPGVIEREIINIDKSKKSKNLN